MNCLKALDDSVIGTLRRQNELFNFKDEKEIEYLTLHVEYVKLCFVRCVLVLVCLYLCACTCVHSMYIHV